MEGEGEGRGRGGEAGGKRIGGGGWVVDTWKER